MHRKRIACAVLLSVGLAATAGAERLQVCTFGFNDPEELAAFASGLPATDFALLDLSPPPLLDAADPAAPAGHAAADTGWFQGVCRSDLRCDVVVYSAEFAGRFFGRSGRSLTLQEMEEASCQARCDGLFHSPREVFLLACNTLATKDDDLRGPAVYLQVLLDHGFDRGSAERVVAMRYGPLGPTFREALRRVFFEVPRLYGFSSVAPLGRYTGPMLDRYFRSVGDYRKHLERLPVPNRALASAFKGTSFVETSGLSSSEPGALERGLICALYDERRPVAERLEIVRRFLERPDILAFVPSVQVFIDRHPADKLRGDERKLFDAIQRNEEARDRVLALIYQLDVSALQLELGHFAVQMGWLARERFQKLAEDTARQLLRRPLSNETVDVMCELPKHELVGDRFRSADLPDGLFRDPEGIRLMSCLAPPGDEISERLAAVLDAEDPQLRLWTAHTLSRRLPLPDDVLMKIIAHLDDPSGDVKLRLRWILQAQRPLARNVRRTLEAKDPQLVKELRTPARRAR